MKGLAIILLFISFYSKAQLQGGNIVSGGFDFRINADGQMANDKKNPASELPTGSGNHLFKFINL